MIHIVSHWHCERRQLPLCPIYTVWQKKTHRAVASHLLLGFLTTLLGVLDWTGRLNSFSKNVIVRSVLHYGQNYNEDLAHFGRPFVKRFALCYQTVVCLSVCLRVSPVLSVTLLYCGQTDQTVWRIKMKISMQVGLVPGHTGLDGDQAPTPPKGHSPHPIFGPYLLRPNGCRGVPQCSYGPANMTNITLHCVSGSNCNLIFVLKSFNVVHSLDPQL